MHKKTQKQLTSILQNKKYRVLLVGVCCGIFLFGILAGFVLMNTANTRRLDMDKLGEVSKDLYALHSLGAKSLDAYGLTDQVKNVCWRSSAKFGKGTITCGSQGIFMVQLTIPRDIQQQTFETTIKGAKNFSYKSTEDIRNDTTGVISGFVIHFQHNTTKTICSAIAEVYKQDVKDVMKYNISCLATVSDYLPGYERQ